MGHGLLESLRLRNAVNEQETALKESTVELTALSGATVDAAALIPAGSLVLGVTARVTTAITGAADFDIGDTTDVDAFGSAIAIALDTLVDLTDITQASPLFYTAATAIRLTGNGSFTGGDIRLTVHYIQLTAPTS